MKFLLENPELDISSSEHLNERDERVYEALIDQDAPPKNCVVTNIAEDWVGIAVKVALRAFSVWLDTTVRLGLYTPRKTIVRYCARSEKFAEEFLARMDSILGERYHIVNRDGCESFEYVGMTTVDKNTHRFRYIAQCIPLYCGHVDCDLVILDFQSTHNIEENLGILAMNANVVGFFNAEYDHEQSLGEKMCRQSPAPRVDWNREFVEKVDHIRVMEVFEERSRVLLHTMICNEKRIREEQNEYNKKN